jgi:hypothetical protein
MPDSHVLAYLAEQQVHLVADDGSVVPVASKFVEDVRRREASIDRKTSWKKQGTGARFMGAAALWDDADGRRQPAFFTCLARGPKRGEILYALTTGVVSGLFAYDLSTGNESRIVHGTDGVPHAIATSDDHSVLAFTRAHKNGSCNVAVMRDDGGESSLVTEGDTVDGAPSWVPVGPAVTEGRHQLVYHSSGIGRDATGAMAGFAPAEILLLDAEHGALKTIVGDPAHDYLAPRMMRDGTLFAMKRPYRRAQDQKDAAAMLKDGVMAPFRLMYAGFRYLDFFTMRYTGKPLTTSGDTRGRRVDARRLLERQNLAGGGDDEAEEAAMRAPREWLLVRRSPRGDETTVASAVCAYDVAPSGDVLVSDGATIHRVDDSGKRTRVASAKLVTGIVALA